MASDLDPEAKRLMEQFDDKISLLECNLPWRERRRLVDEIVLYGKNSETVSMNSVEDLMIPGEDDSIPIRLYRPLDAEELPGIVFFHGGGFFCGSIETHDPLCRNLALETKCMVISVGYRLAPEHPFPEPLLDAYEATNWVIDNSEKIGGTESWIAVAGDSAGGNLATSVALLNAMENTKKLDHQILIYPAVDYDSGGEVGFETDGPLTTNNSANIMWNHYLRSRIDGYNPFASPLKAKELYDMPPTTVVTCGFDTHLNEGKAYADRLRTAGVAVKEIHFEHMFHPFLNFPQLDKAQEAYTAISESIDPVTT